MATPETATIKETTYNGIQILQDSDGFFNVSKLVNHYQPNNKNTARYLRTKKFSEIFDGKARALSLNQGGGANQTERKMLKSQDMSLAMKEIKGNRKTQGLYLPREYLDVILMIIHPEYRAVVHEIMETVNESKALESGKSLTIKTDDFEKEVVFDSVRNDRLAHSMAGDDPVEYWRYRHDLSDSMW
jgi:hypothetical protein